MFYADQVGLVQVAARLADFAASTGDASLRPAPLLRRLADEGRGFASPAAEKAA
jgi:3-hydroxyacyl-CoA dehydrogenase